MASQSTPTGKTVSTDADVEGIKEELRGATEKFEKAEQALEEARNDLQELVVKALRAGITPTETAELTPWTSTHTRYIAREAGIPPARKGGRSQSRRAASGRLSGSR